jgi:hypothetical protein
VWDAHSNQEHLSFVGGVHSLANSADGKFYRWDVLTNALTESIQLTSGIGQANGVGDARVVHVDVHVPAQAALVIENVGAQARVGREQVVEHGTHAGARHLPRWAREIPLQIRGERNAGQDHAPLDGG